MTESNQFQLRVSDRNDVRTRGERVMSLARKYLSQTALVIDKPWTGIDLDAANQFYSETAALVHPNVYPSFWQHSQLASLYHGALAKIFDLNQPEFETIGLLHDAGSLVVPHQYNRKDLMTEFGMQALGVRAQVMDKLISLKDILVGNTKSPADLSLPQQINLVADALSKKRPDGSMVNVDDIISYTGNMNFKYPNPRWPSEKRGIGLLIDKGGAARYADLLRLVCQNLEHKGHFRLTDVSRQVREVSELEQNQVWLAQVQGRMKETENQRRLGVFAYGN